MDEGSLTRVHEVLIAARAYCPETAITDAEIAKRAGVAARNVVRIARALLRRHIVVCASCGQEGTGRAGKGRYIERDPVKIRAHGRSLLRRGGSICDRGRDYIHEADYIDAANLVESNGQRRMFA